MRQRIQERRMEHNIKTGAGGIRDIEFLAQYHYQLGFAGQYLSSDFATPWRP